jgi:hypothetical protein
MFINALIGSAGLAAIAVVATPAAAQSYGGYNQGGIVGAVIDSVLGGGRYGAYGQGDNRIGVDQCARAAEAQLSGGYRSSRYGAYGRGYGDRGYDNYAMTSARVTGITRVERSSNGLRVSGLIDSGVGYGNQYGNQGYDPRYNQGYGNQAYGYGNQVADLRFNCRVDYRGRVTSLDIRRNDRRGL